MSLDTHSPHGSPCTPVAGGSAPPPKEAVSLEEFWNSLIDEKVAGGFLGLSDRAMQKMRQTGGGPRYVHISSRCLRYRRVDLRTWAESRIRTSTSDPGRAAA